MNNELIVRCGYIYKKIKSGNAKIVKDDFGILIEGGKVATIGKYPFLKSQHPTVKVVGDPNKIAIPGFCDHHQHARGVSMLLRGVADQQFEIWRSQYKNILKVDRLLDTIYSDLQLFQSGVTSTIHFFYPGTNQDYLGELIKTINGHEKSGMRTQIVLGWKDIDSILYSDLNNFQKNYGTIISESDLRLFNKSIQSAGLIYKKFVLFVFREILPRCSDLITFSLGPVSPHWCSNQLLYEIRELSDLTGWNIHTHLLETIYQKKVSDTIQQNPLVRLKETGLLNKNTVLAHCVWVDRNDLDLISKSGAGIIFNPSANLRLSSGIAPISLIMEAGIPCALGTDSLCLNDHYDFFQEIRLFNLLARIPNIGNPFSSINLEIGLPFLNFEKYKLGSIEPGFNADVMLIDTQTLYGEMNNIETPTDMLSLLISRGNKECISHLITGGNIIIEDRNLVNKELLVNSLGDLPNGITDNQNSSTINIKHLMYYLERVLEKDANYFDSL